MFHWNKTTFVFEGNTVMHDLVILPSNVLLKGPALGKHHISADPAQGISENGCAICTKLGQGTAHGYGQMSRADE